MAKYVLLRIGDEREADDFLRDLALYPEQPLLTPSQENPVHVELVAEHDAVDGPPSRLLPELQHSYHRASELALKYEKEA